MQYEEKQRGDGVMITSIREFDSCNRRLREIFSDHIEVPTQSQIGILPACEQPETVSTFQFQGLVYPLPQTGQIGLEIALLRDPSLKRVFCQTTSYRNEMDSADKERYDRIFNMFEFEGLGGKYELSITITDTLKRLGFFKNPTWQLTYEEMCERYNVESIGAKEEALMQRDYGNVIMLYDFPKSSHPFWNMQQNKNGIYGKIDVILFGVETFGTAVRSCDPDQQRRDFYSLSDGQYSQLLFRTFGKQRVIDELEAYLALPMIPRYGGGIGISRLCRALRLLEANK